MLTPAGAFKDDLISTSVLQNRSVTNPKLALDALGHFTAGGGPNALTATLTPPATEYVDGMMVRLLIASDNTAAVILNVDGLGPKDVKKFGDEDLEGGDLLAGDVCDFVYSGGVFKLVSPSKPAFNRRRQFLTYESDLTPIPAIGTATAGNVDTFSHGFLNAGVGIMPFITQVRLVRTATGTQSFGGTVVGENEEINGEIVYSANKGNVDPPIYFPAVRVHTTPNLVKVEWFYYPDSPLAIQSQAWGGSGATYARPEITPNDYKYRVRALALNPDFPGA